MRKQHASGFTLIEIMVVVVILGLLIGIVVPNVFRHVEEARRSTAQAEMKQLGGAVDLYRMSKRRLPPTLQTLTEADATGEPYLEVIPRDPWDRDYRYRQIDRRHYEIRCLGGDGEENTEDDLVHPVTLKDV